MPVSEAQKNANKKYRATHREKVNEYSAKCMKEKYQNDPEYRARKLAKVKEYSDRKKAEKASRSES
jgi:hypothetical protein